MLAGVRICFFLLLSFFSYSSFAVNGFNKYYDNRDDAAAAAWAYKLTKTGSSSDCQSSSRTSCAQGGTKSTAACTALGTFNDGYRVWWYNSQVGDYVYDYFWGCRSTIQCSGGKSIDPDSGSCSCPSGTYDNGLGSCIIKPADCTLQEFNAYTEGCPVESSYTGWSQHTCWDTGSNSVKSVPACDPQCAQGTHLENHTCVSNPTCVGDQTYNFGTNHCDEPVCSGGQTLDSTNHVCVDPTCNATQILCGHACITKSNCQAGYAWACNEYGIAECQYNGCPDGFVGGSVNGHPYCAKSGLTSKATVKNLGGTQQGTTITSQSPDGSTITTQYPDGSTETTTTSINPDGSLNVSTSKTAGDGSADPKIDIDTSGLAQESTIRELMSGTAKPHADVTTGSFDDAVPTQAAEDARLEYKNTFDSIKAQITALFQPSLSGSAQLPIIDFGIIKGSHVVVDLNLYSVQLSWIGLTILFIAMCIAAYIILS